MNETKIVNEMLNYRKLMDYVTDMAEARERCTFEELRKGDKVYEVVETKQRISIVPRLVEMSNNVGKKTHFTLVHFQGLKDCKYCPYSNKSYTVSKQFNPIFLNYKTAYLYIRQKLANDIRHSEMVANRIKGKYSNFCIHEKLTKTSNYSTMGSMSYTGYHGIQTIESSNLSNSQPIESLPF